MTKLKKYQVRISNGHKSDTHIATFLTQKEAIDYINKYNGYHSTRSMFIKEVPKVVNPYRKLRKVS